MLGNIERILKKAVKKKPKRPTTEQVARRLAQTTQAANKNKRDETARGKKPLEICDVESDDEDSVEREDEEQSQHVEPYQEVEQSHSVESDQETADDDQNSGDEEDDVESEIREVEVVQPVRRQTRARPSKPNQRQMLKIFKWMRFAGTRFPHQQTLRELGLKRDVEYLMEMCGVATMMSQRCGAFKDETCEFLSSLVLHFYEDAGIVVDPSAGLGYITFTVNGAEYSLTMNQLDTLYGFPKGRGRCPEFRRDELLSLWKTIGDKKEYASASSKSARIRSPVIRYLHKSIAHTFFARKITGNVNEGELQFLDTAIGHVTNSTSDGVALRGDTSDTGLTVALLDQFLYYRSWASTLYKRGVQGELSIGGLVTPILVAAGIDLTGKEFKPKWMDIEYLTKTGFLDKDPIDGRHAYKFYHPLTSTEVLLPLPCVEHTRIRGGTNIDFCPPPELCYDTYIFRTPQDQNTESEEEREPNSSDQFDFEDYTAPRQGAAVKAANKNIGLLKLWNKYQGKAIKSLKESVSEMKEQIKELQRKLNGSSSRTAAEEGATPAVIERSRSLIHDITAMRQHHPTDPPRASSYEPREGSRKRRAMPLQTDIGASSSYRVDPRVELGTEHEQLPLPAYTRESMEASVDSFFSQH